MGEVIPLTPGIAAELLRKQRETQARARQIHNLLWHGLPTLTAALFVGAAATGIITHAGAEQNDGIPRCGVGITSAGEGYQGVLADALADAGVEGGVRNFYGAVRQMPDLDPSLNPGDRFVVTVENGQITSIGTASAFVDACAGLIPQS